MTESDASQGQSASELISKRIAELGDWRGETLSTMRELIKEEDPDVVEELKWVKPSSPGTLVRPGFDGDSISWRMEPCQRIPTATTTVPSVIHLS
jgi:hypothetical protein